MVRAESAQPCVHNKIVFSGVFEIAMTVDGFLCIGEIFIQETLDRCESQAEMLA